MEDPVRLGRKHTDLEVYRRAFNAAMRIYDLSKGFPPEERASLTDPLRHSSRAVCARIAEAWRKRRHEGSFCGKMADAEAEAAETQVWLQFAYRCSYLPRNYVAELKAEYDVILGMLVNMTEHPDEWAV